VAADYVRRILSKIRHAAKAPDDHRSPLQDVCHRPTDIVRRYNQNRNAPGVFTPDAL
jgi:hypothetical protein